MRALLHFLSAVLLSVIPAGAGDVSLTQDARDFRMSNGALTVVVEKRSGRVAGVRLGDVDLLGKGSGYWSMAASSGRSRVSGFGVSKEQFVSIDPETNDGERAEVVCRFHGTGDDQAYPGRSGIRYSICQPLDLSPDCQVLGDSTWKVRFPMEKIPAGGTRLLISFCGSREGAELTLALNGAEIGRTGPLPENGAMHRDSSRGFWFERAFDIPASRLREGENVLEFRLSGSQWHQGVLYDCLRMEAVSPPVSAS